MKNTKKIWDDCMGWSQLFFEIHVPPKNLQQVQLSNARGGEGENLNFTTVLWLLS